MEHYRQSLLIQARPSVLYAALTTEAGLRGWWTQDCDVARVPATPIACASVLTTRI